MNTRPECRNCNSGSWSNWPVTLSSSYPDFALHFSLMTVSLLRKFFFFFWKKSKNNCGRLQDNLHDFLPLLGHCLSTIVEHLAPHPPRFLARAGGVLDFGGGANVYLSIGQVQHLLAEYLGAQWWSAGLAGPQTVHQPLWVDDEDFHANSVSGLLYASIALLPRALCRPHRSRPDLRRAGGREGTHVERNCPGRAWTSPERSSSLMTSSAAGRPCTAGGCPCELYGSFEG